MKSTAEIVNLADRRQDTPPLGMIFDADLTLEQWLEVGRQLRAQHTRSRFYIGDWALAGDRFGESANQSDYADETIRTYKYVASRIPIARRRDLPLTFGHHQAVASCEPAEQDELLDLALKHRWNREELRARVRRRREEREAAIQAARADSVEEAEEDGDLPDSTFVGGALVAFGAPHSGTLDPVPEYIEPSPPRRMSSAEDAAAYLRSLLANGALAPNLAWAVHSILDERSRLTAIYRQACHAVDAGTLTVGLMTAVAEAE